MLIVLGSQNSSNSRRLMEIGQSFGKPAYLVDGAHELQPEWFNADQTVVITAGASAPEEVVQECVDYLVDRFDATVREVTFRRESVNFPLRANSAHSRLTCNDASKDCSMSTSPEHPEHLKSLTTVSTDVEASAIVSALDAEGIRAKAVGGYHGRFPRKAPGGVSIIVAEADLARAKQVLDDVRQHKGDVDWSQVDVEETDET